MRNDLKTLGSALKEIRTRSGRNQADLSIGGPRASQIERDIGNPQFSTVSAWLNDCGATLHDLADLMCGPKKVEPNESAESVLRMLEAEQRRYAEFRVATTRIVLQLLNDSGLSAATRERLLSRLYGEFESVVTAMDEGSDGTHDS